MLLSLLNVTKYLLIFILQNISLLLCYLYTKRIHDFANLSFDEAEEEVMNNIYGQECLFQTNQPDGCLV